MKTTVMIVLIKCEAGMYISIIFIMILLAIVS